MIFEDMRIKDVRAVIHYTPNMAGWYAKERKDHFIGIQLCGSAHHKFNNRDFVLSSNCVYFFNQKDDYRVEVYERGESFSVHFTTYEDVETDSFCVPVENPEEATIDGETIEGTATDEVATEDMPEAQAQ